MTDKQPNQAMGSGKPATDDNDPVEKPAAWDGGGESGGGARPGNPAGAADGAGSGGFMGHGGQSHIEYSGTGDEDGEENDNAATRAD